MRFFLLAITAFVGVLSVLPARAVLMVQGAPETASFTQIMRSGNLCFKFATQGTCYYCGTSNYTQACSTLGCTTYKAMSAGESVTIPGTNARMGCTGSSTCYVPGNGLLTYKDGNPSNTEFLFYTVYSIPTKNCKVKLHGGYCSQWLSSTQTIDGREICKCANATSNIAECEYCEEGYYLSGGNCKKCACMTDVNGVSRCGATNAGPYHGASNEYGCEMGTEYTFKDSTGSYNFTTPCPYGS